MEATGKLHRLRRWNWTLVQADACAFRAESTPLRFGPFFPSRGNAHDRLAGERAGLPVRDGLRHAQELRRSAALVTQSMEITAFARHLFVFSNRRRDRVKILCWDRDGVRCLGEETGRWNLCDAVRGQRRRAARDLGAGTGSAVERYRSESAEAAETIPEKHRRSRSNR